MQTSDSSHLAVNDGDAKSAQPPSSDALNAARYRWLRENPISVLWEMFRIEAGRNPDEELDAAIDNARGSKG